MGLRFGTAPPTMTREFNFHNIVGLRLDSGDAVAIEFFQAELGEHAGQIGDGLAEVALRWRSAALPKSPGSGYQRQLHKRLAHWHYRIELSQRSVQIDCAGNRIALPMAWHMLIHPSMSYLVANKGSLMLHGAAVVCGGKSLIVTGPGGVGKTTTSSLLLRASAEWKLHADDSVFLGPGWNSFSFATPTLAYADLLRWLPELRSTLSASELLRLLVSGSLMRLSGGRVRWPVRVGAKRLWPNREMASMAQLGAILLVGPRSGDAIGLRRLELAEDPAGELLAVNFRERRHFSRLLRRTSGVQIADAILHDWRRRERALLDRIVAAHAVYELRIPERPNSGLELARELSAKLKELLDVRNEVAPHHGV